MKRIVTLVLTALLLATPARADVQELRILAAGVDRSSTVAEALALDYAKKRAVYLVARKLAIDAPGDRVAALKPEQFNEIIRGATILRTRREGDRTYAEVNVSVVDTALKRALKLPETDGRDLETDGNKMRAVLVLPVFVKNDRPYLWEEENSLRDPLRAEVLRQAHGAVLVPAGDLDDLRLIDYQNALSVSAPELAPMFTRYGADEIIISIFMLGKDNETPPSILLRRLSPKASRSEVVKLSTGIDEKTPVKDRIQAAARVIASAVTQIASSSAEADQARLAAAKKLPIIFNFANPRELATMQEAIRNAPGVLLLEVPSISVRGMKAIAYMESEPQKLRELLVKQGIIVSQQGDGLQLSLR